MKAQPSLTYTAACPRCGHDCTWTAETYYDDITTPNHPVSDTDGGKLQLRAGARSGGGRMKPREESMRYLVQFSTGAGSAEVAWRAVERHGPDVVHLLTADTLVEDEDNWRFAKEVVAQLGCGWTVLADGRTPMQVGRDARIVPNNRLAVCSRILKRDLLRAHIEENYDAADTVILLGFDWTEEHRLNAALPHWAPWRVEAPLMDPPYLMKPMLLDLFRERGIEPPRLYAQGFTHANCGGGCVRGGQAQWELLLRVNRPRYLEWEAEEEKTRALLGKDVSILRDRTKGGTRALPLASFREGIDAQPSMFDADDWGACGCFTTEEPA